MASVKIVLRKEKQKKDGTFPLAIRITQNRKPRYIHIGPSIIEKDWDADISRVRKSHPNAARLNNLLLKKLSEANDIALETETTNKNASSKEIKKKVARKGQPVSFFAFGAARIKNKFLSEVYSVAKAERSILCNIDEFVNHRGHESRKAAIAGIKARRQARIAKGRQPGYSFLEELKLFTKNTSLYFDDINEVFLTRFKSFCVSHLAMQPRTITNQLLLIRTLFNDAIGEKIVERKHYPFGGDGETIKIVSGHKIGLTKEEVARIEDIDLPKGSQIWHTRNVWLVAYYFAGIRITDAVSLIWSDFKDGRLYYVMHKNEKPVSLKVPDKAQEILTHYKNSKTRKKDYVFPYLSTANRNDAHDLFVKTRNATWVLNKYLKRLAEACDIDKNLSNHIARHTFGNIAGDRINPLMLQKLYRHSDLKTTINYQANFIHREADDALDNVIG